MKGCGQHLSDIEVYRRATKMYFPDSEVDCVITITTGEPPDDNYLSKEPKKRTAEKSSKEKTVGEKKTPAKAKESEVIQLTLF